jgi:hypothetical protein
MKKQKAAGNRMGPAAHTHLKKQYDMKKQNGCKKRPGAFTRLYGKNVLFQKGRDILSVPAITTKTLNDAQI